MVPELSADQENSGSNHADLVGTARSTPHRRDPRPPEYHLAFRGISALTPVSGLAGGAQQRAEDMESHLVVCLTDRTQQLPKRHPLGQRIDSLRSPLGPLGSSNSQHRRTPELVL